MKINVSRDLLLEKLTLASRFTSNKLSSSTTLQGVLIKGIDSGIHIYSTNLNAYYHTSIKTPVDGTFQAILEPKKIMEFLHFLNPGSIDLDIKDKQVTIVQEKTKGNFPLMENDEFPMPPEITEKEQQIESAFLNTNLPLVLFTASQDESRPVLTGVNFTHMDEDLVMVSTDGFRLSILREKSPEGIPSMIIPADFVQEVIRNVKELKEIGFSYSQKERIAMFRLGEDEYYTRLIDGDFPPFEKVIPAEYKTKAIIDRTEMLRNIKLISVFARDYSNVIICEFKQDGLYIRPKKETNEDNTAYQEIQIEGEDQKVAFNFKFLVDFLNHATGDTIQVEILRSDAPAVFRMKDNTAFFHIIMPVRIQE